MKHYCLFICLLSLFCLWSKSVHPSPSERLAAIKATMQSGPIIGGINIAGHYPYIEAKIRKRLTLQVGDLWQPEVIEEQKERIIRFFERQGFYNTAVRVDTKPTARENHILVTFYISKGDRLRYGNVTYKGNRAVPIGRLANFIRPMKLYSERRFKTALRELEEYYRYKGYLKARIHVTKKKVNYDTKRVDVKIKIKEGPRVKVSFRGKRHYHLKTLKETITLYREGNFDSVELQSSAEAIENRLKEDGYPEAKVTFQKKRIRPDLYHVFFEVQPERPRRIQKIAFQGNQVISDRKIKKQLLLKEHSITQKGVFQEELLKEDQKLTEEYYHSQGFAYVQIEGPKVLMNPKQTRYQIEYLIVEGPRVLVKKITFQGIEEFPEKKILAEIKNKMGKPLNQTMLPEDQTSVARFFKNRGYPYVQVEQKVWLEASEATIHYLVDRGPLVTIGEIVFVGDVLTGVRPLQSALAIKSGEPYNEKKIIEGGLNLRRLGTFEAVSVEPIGLEEKATVIHLYIKVEERKPFVIDLETQFSTDQRYTGTLKFTNFNSFGWAKQTRLSLTGGIEKNRVELSWLDPRFWGADLQMSLASWMDYEKRVLETSLQTGGAISFFRLFRRFGFLGRYQLTKTYVIEGQSADPNALRDNVLSEISLSGSYDRRDNFADPTRGYFSLIGARIFNEISGQRADFTKLRAAFSHYLTPFKLITFSSTLRLDRIQDLITAASIPQRELYGLGGDDTIRGFKEDRAGPLDADGNLSGGRTRIIFNEEMQLRLFRSIQIAVFYDGGTLTSGLDDIDLGTYRNSYGFGLRYITPVGPIRADYGIIIDRQPGENFGRFHLTFGYLF